MDISQIIVTTSGIALIGLTLWFFFGGRAKSPQKDTGAQYACPMHPWITSSDPAADCSICGMKLVRSEVSKQLTR
jgi:hypothetical protein